MASQYIDIPFSIGGGGGSGFTVSAFLYYNGTNVVSTPGITTDGQGNLIVSGNIVSNNGTIMWTNSVHYAVSRGIFSP